MLTTNIKTDVIDADAHVVENERVWDYLDTGEEKYRPTLLAEPGNSERQHWVLDGEDLGPKFPSPNEKQSEEHLKRFGREVKTPVEARELGDVSQRLRHMDALGIDVQVLYNSLWLRPLTRRPEVEIALCWSWNRWMADVWKLGENRLRWSCVVPARVGDSRCSRCQDLPLGGQDLPNPYYYNLSESPCESRCLVWISQRSTSDVG